jgi:hypothetical protein
MIKTTTAEVEVIGIDIGENSFRVVGFDKKGAVVLRLKWSRGQTESRLANLKPCVAGVEACNGAQHLAGKLNALGHDARLAPAKYVRPYAKGQRNELSGAVRPRPVDADSAQVGGVQKPQTDECDNTCEKKPWQDFDECREKRGKCCERLLA